MRIISENEFTSETESGVVIVDFYASWCSPCRVLMPIRISEYQCSKMVSKKIDS